jgi:hypothetical protein
MPAQKQLLTLRAALIADREETPNNRAIDHDTEAA